MEGYNMVLVQQTLHDTESIKLLDDEVQLHIIDGAKSWSWATVHKKNSQNLWDSEDINIHNKKKFV